MMADNHWTPEDLVRKVKDLANSPGVTDRARIESIQVLVAQYAAQHSKPKPEDEE